MRLTEVAQQASYEDWDLNDDPDYGGAILSALDELVVAAAEILMDNLWHPVRARHVVVKRLRTLDAREQELRGHDDGRLLPWSRRGRTEPDIE